MINQKFRGWTFFWSQTTIRMIRLGNSLICLMGPLKTSSVLINPNTLISKQGHSYNLLSRFLQALENNLEALTTVFLGFNARQSEGFS